MKTSRRTVNAINKIVTNPVIIVDKKGNIVASNQKTLEEFQWSEDEIKGKPIEVLIPERFKEDHINYRDEYLEEPISKKTKMMSSGEDKVIGLKRDGTEFQVEVELSSLISPEPLTMAYITVV